MSDTEAGDLALVDGAAETGCHSDGHPAERRETWLHAAEVIGTRFDVPVVYLTAHSDKYTVERARITRPAVRSRGHRQGGQGHDSQVLKPFDPVPLNVDLPDSREGVVVREFRLLEEVDRALA